jgi:hypothetical protein
VAVSFAVGARDHSRQLQLGVTASGNSCYNPWSSCCLQEKGRGFRESFLSKLALLLKGTVAAPSNRFGETLADEHLRGGETLMGQPRCMLRTAEVAATVLSAMAWPCTCSCAPHLNQVYST